LYPFRRQRLRFPRLKYKAASHLGLKKLQRFAGGKLGLIPANSHALREPAAIIAGNVAVARAGLGGAVRSIAIAKEAADFLIWAQQQAGTGVFPFPAARGVSGDGAFLASERYLRRAEKAGRLGDAVKNNWAINDDGDGGLQFDNGECGVALLELYEFTKDKKYLDSAVRAADWALGRPLVTNWNYNSFSVFLLARTYRATQDPRHLAAATQKALLGVIPGQLTSGANAGRWGDAHNARASYHYIMLRALAELLAVTPQSAPAYATLSRSLKLGLQNRNRDFLERGVPNKDKAMEVLVLVNRQFADAPAFLEDTFSAQALVGLTKLVSAQARRGNAPLGPREWGQFLEFLAWKQKR
jgi:hypothetical protein